jgi:hypothetical protein
VQSGASPAIRINSTVVPGTSMAALSLLLILEQEHTRGGIPQHVATVNVRRKQANQPDYPAAVRQALCVWLASHACIPALQGLK